MPVSLPLVVHGAALLDETGSFVDGLDVEVVDGVIAAVGPALSTRGADVVDAAGRWLMPGIVDCHSHVFWNAFHAADRDASPVTYRAYEALSSLDSTLRAGVTSVRDAGGADRGVRDALAAGIIRGPRLQISDTIIGFDPDRTGPDAMRQRVAEVLRRGADWIKLLATGGVTAPEGTDLESSFSAAEFRAAVDEAATGGARVMVHAWGGDAITDAITAGVASIEHGMFLTDEQASAGARAGVALVPTLTIYREVAAMAASGALPPFVAERVARVAVAHPEAVRKARDAGMAVALGSDFGTPDQHGRNLAEIAALAEAGLGVEGALLAATSVGTHLLRDRERGRLAVGQVFDAVLLGRSPADPGVFRDPSTVTAVWQSGIAVA